MLLVEERLPMVAGEDVVREVRRFAPDTAAVAQVAYSDRAGVLLGAGAAAVSTRQTPPGEVAQALLELLGLDPG